MSKLQEKSIQNLACVLQHGESPGAGWNQTDYGQEEGVG